MYLEHFGLAASPFGLSPKLEFLYKSEAFQESMAHLIYGVDSSEAIIMITGAIGTGKTMALQSFMTNLSQNFKWALVTNTQVGPKELLKLILDDLGVGFPLGCDKSDLLILFKDFLIQTSRGGKRVIVIIDEAQNMPCEVLEEVRLLTNLGQGKIQPVQVILVGQPELETVVNRTDLAQLRQRIRVHYRLDPLSRKEVEEYLDHRMAVAGCRDRVFKSDAVDRIAKSSGGVPRLVNSLASQALLSAFVDGRRQVLAKDVVPPEGIAPVSAKDRRPEPVPVPEPTPKTSPDGVHPVVPEPEYAVRRGREPRRRGSLAVSFVVILLVLVLVSLYLHGDLQMIMNRFVPTPDGPLTSWKAANTLARSGGPDAFFPEVADSLTVVTTERDSFSPSSADTTGVRNPDTTTKMKPATLDPGAAIPEPEARDGTTEAEPDSTPAKETQGTYFAHVASFQTLERAQRFVDQLQANGFHTLVRSHVVTGNTWQRVFIGPYPDRPAAKDAVAHIKGLDDSHYYHITAIAPDGEGG